MVENAMVGSDASVAHVTRLLLLEDHASFRQAMAFVFGADEQFTVVAQFGTLADAREYLRENPRGVDIAVLDLTLPDGSGEDLLHEITANKLELLTLVLSASADPDDFARAVEAGADGVLHKSASLQEILQSVKRLQAGEALLSPFQIIEMLRSAGRRRQEQYEAKRIVEKLTAREREVLRSLAEGLDSQEIANKLSITVETERTHMVNILRKLNAHSRLQALVFAVRNGIAEIR